MEVEIVVLGERSAEEILRWTVRSRSDVISAHWQHLALALVRRARQGQRGVGEVYLCYRGERPEEYLDLNFLETLIHLCREHAWGSSVHVVVDARDLLPESIEDYKDSIEEWFKTEGVAAFLQVRMDPNGVEPVDLRLLRSACDRARNIAENLKPAEVRDVVWGPALTGLGGQHEQYRAFLSPLIPAWDPLQDTARTDPHPLIVVHGHGEGSQHDIVEEALKLCGPGRPTIATVGVRPETRLREYCDAQKLGLVWFRGFYELKYFLLRGSSGGRAVRRPRQVRPAPRDEFTSLEDRLREVFRQIQPEHPQYRGALLLEHRLRENIETARLTEDTAALMALRAERAEVVEYWNDWAIGALGIPFNRLCDIDEAAGGTAAGTHEVFAPGAGGSLLVTTSLDPESQAELCLQAARLVGRLLLELPPPIVPCMQLALNRTVLGDMIDGMPAIAGWIFIGTASGEGGLPEAPSGELRSPEEWSACFGGLDPEIPLAMFLAGDSVEVARRFARSGAAVCSIGFRVLAHDLVSPARRILREVLNGRSDLSRIESILSNGSRGGVFFAEGR